MRIAILTFHAAHNYGAVLQTYALQTFLQERSFDVSVLDYRPYYIRHPYALIPSQDYSSQERKWWKIGWGYFLFFFHVFVRIIPARLRFRKQFIRFTRSALNVSSFQHNSPFVSDYDYDVYIIGSDQVWNPKITFGFDDVFWGNFTTKSGARKIAYAASMVSSDYFPAHTAYMYTSLKNNFSHISVREEPTAKLLGEVLGQDVPVVLDPTLLIEKHIWDSIAECPKVPRKYVLVYTLHCEQEAVSMAEKIAKQIGASVIQIVGGSKFRLRSYQRIPTPEVFVGLFKYAEFVVAGSFHGTAFSIVFEKPFVSILKGSMADTRPREVVEKLGLQQCLVLPTARPDFFELDYEVVRSRLKDERGKSILFLSQAIGK